MLNHSMRCLQTPRGAGAQGKLEEGPTPRRSGTRSLQETRRTSCSSPCRPYGFWLFSHMHSVRGPAPSATRTRSDGQKTNVELNHHVLIASETPDVEFQALDGAWRPPLPCRTLKSSFLWHCSVCVLVRILRRVREPAVNAALLKIHGKTPESPLYLLDTYSHVNKKTLWHT